MENNINTVTVTTGNDSACSGEQPQPDGTITSTHVYSSQTLNGITESNILPTENMKVCVWVSEQNNMPELNSLDGKSAELVLSVKNCENLVGNGDPDIENSMADSQPNHNNQMINQESTTNDD